MKSKEGTLNLGADIGGSHITVAVVEEINDVAVVQSTVRNRVDSFADADDILTTWVSTIKSKMSAHQSENVRLSIAMPGPFDYENGISLIKNMNKYEALYLTDVKKHLINKLKLLPENVIFKNDAEAFLHGEVCFGAAKGAKTAIGITLGTGLGSAKSIGGVTQDANLGVSKFKEGIAEDYLSTRWFTKRYHDVTGETIKDTLALVEVYEHNLTAQMLFDEFAANLGDFLHRLLHEFAAEVVVIGGNITRSHPLFLNKTKAFLSAKGIHVEIRITELWEDAAILGAHSVNLTRQN